jgi:conjugal transfer mating pair stabilization protein TraN
MQPVKIIAILSLCAMAKFAFGQSLICAADLNGNGVIDSAGEQAACLTYTSGSLCPIAAEQCVTGSNGTPTCPTNPAQPCLDTGSGVMKCSPYTCFDPSTIQKMVTTVQPTSSANGMAMSSTGACMGTLYIFPGSARNCRSVGVDTAFINCCNSSNAMKDTMGSSNQIDTLNVNLSDVEKQIVDHCTPNDEATDFQNNSGQCIYLGNYCAQKWPLVGCVQSARSYCCFNSMLARIIQQQGRPQIPSMGGFGTPEAPNCAGFTVQQFQSLDFSKIDLSEYAAQIQTNSQSNIENTVHGIATQQLPPSH